MTIRHSAGSAGHPTSGLSWLASSTIGPRIFFEGEGVGAPVVAPPVAPPTAVPPTAAPVVPVAPAGGQPWYGGIQDENVRNLMEAKALGNPEDAAKAYYEANKYISSQTDIVIPKADAPPEMWDRYREKIGVPKTADEYKFDYGKLPDGTPAAADPKFETFARSTFHKAGLPPEQAQKIVGEWQGFVAATMAENKANDDAAINTLKGAWGPKWDENIAAGQKIVGALALPDEHRNAINGAVGSPAMLALFAELGKRMGGESPFVSVNAGGGQQDVATLPPGQAKMEVARLNSDPAFLEAYNTKGHPGHDAAVQRMLGLMARAHSTG